MPQKEPEMPDLAMQREDIENILMEDIPEIENKIISEEIVRRFKASKVETESWWKKWNDDLENLLEI